MPTLDAMYQVTHIVLQCRHTAWISYSYNKNFDLYFALCKENGEFFWLQVDGIPTGPTVVTCLNTVNAKSFHYQLVQDITFHDSTHNELLPLLLVIL